MIIKLKLVEQYQYYDNFQYVAKKNIKPGLYATYKHLLMILIFILHIKFYNNNESLSLRMLRYAT
jgi:hypothetical protein